MELGGITTFMNTSQKIFLAVIITALVVGGGTYYLVNRQAPATNVNQTAGNQNTNADSVSMLADCQTSGLTVSLENGSGAAGTYYYNLVMTNVGTQSCAISGTPTIAALDATGTLVGQTTSEAHVATKLTVVPQGKAYASVGFPNMANFDVGVCQPMKSLVVYLAGQTTGLTIANIDTYSSAYTSMYCQALSVSDFSATAQ